MTIIEELKTKSLKLRKEKNPIAASITFAISEIEKVGKNNGNRATTEDEAIKTIQKLIATIEENLKLDIDEGRKIALTYEKNILQSVLPKMATEEEIKTVLAAKFTNPSKKEVMQWSKTNWGALADMKLVGKVASELFNI